MTDCPNREKNRARCNCTYVPCPRHGECCACVAYHRERRELPACYFSDKAERSYDRSIAAFLQAQP